MNHKYTGNNDENPESVAPCDNCGMRMTDEGFPKICPGPSPEGPCKNCDPNLMKPGGSVKVGKDMRSCIDCGKDMFPLTEKISDAFETSMGEINVTKKKLKGFLNAIMPKHKDLDVSNIRFVEKGSELKDIWDRFDEELPDARGIFEGGDPYGSRRSAIKDFFHKEIVDILEGLREEYHSVFDDRTFDPKFLVAANSQIQIHNLKIDKLINSL